MSTITDLRAMAKDCRNARMSPVLFHALDHAADEIERLRAESERLRTALRPFSEISGEMFARNWEKGRVVVALDAPERAHRLLFDDFLNARAALMKPLADPNSVQSGTI